jgi:hypothetical protein
MQLTIKCLVLYLPVCLLLSRKCVNLVKHALLMADNLKVLLFETSKLCKLCPTQALPFDPALANCAHVMDDSTLFITLQLSIYVQF